MAVRELVRGAKGLSSSALAVTEFHAVIHRHIREGVLSAGDGRMVAAPADLFVRSADAIHLVTAADMGEHEVWTGDRHMLRAAEYFGVRGRSVEYSGGVVG